MPYSLQAFTPEGQWVPGPPREGLVPSPWCPAKSLGDLGHFGQTTTPFVFAVFAALVGYTYWRLRKAGGTLLP